MCVCVFVFVYVYVYVCGERERVLDRVEEEPCGFNSERQVVEPVHLKQSQMKKEERNRRNRRDQTFWR